MTVSDSDNARDLTPDLRVVMIVGATATGKTGLSLELAKHLPLEIINADSRYLYRGMDIGTAKPSWEEQEAVPHHLVDILDPTDDFSLAHFLALAFKTIEDVADRGRLPVVVGGTPLYLRALYEGWRTPGVAPDPVLRAKLEQYPVERLFEEVRSVDPVSADRIGPANVRRLVRALEVFKVAGRPMSDLEGKEPAPYRWLVVGLRRDRDILHERVAARARWMFENGLLEEARQLQQLDPATPSLSAIGYREAIEVVQGTLDLEEAIEQTIHATNRYLRHQMTWLRKFPDIEWFDAGSESLVDEVLDRIEGSLDISVDAPR